jgi:membrane fusion protein, multidrug efflux system
MTPHNLTRLVAVLSIILSAAACRRAGAALPPPPPAVGVSAVEKRPVSVANELTGRVEAVSRVEIRPRVAGYVTSVRYREGSEVAAGAVLFTIDDRPYRAVLDRATAELSRAKASAEFARADAGRAEKLLASNTIAQVDRDRAVSAAAQAEAQVQSAAANVALARLDLEFTQVRAPIAGRAGQAMVVRGDYVSAGPPPPVLTTVVSVDPVYVYFTGDEQTFLRFASHAERMPVTVGLADEARFPHEGTVDFVDNRLDPATGTIRVRALVPNKDKRLTPGLYAKVRLSEGRPLPALLIDDRAVLTDQDRKYVFTVGAEGVAARRDVKLGQIVDGRRIVDSGLQEGDRVIVSGIQKVMPGSKVTIAADPGARP